MAEEDSFVARGAESDVLTCSLFLGTLFLSKNSSFAILNKCAPRWS